MTEKEFLKEIGSIREEYIEEAAEPAKKAVKRFPVYRVTAIAASLAVVLACTFGILKWQNPSSAVEETGKRIGFSSELETTEVAFVCMSEIKIENGRFAGFIGRRVLAEQYVGEAICDAEVDEYMRYSDGKIDERQTIAAKVYAIRGVSPELAVCVKLESAGNHHSAAHYYVFRDTISDFETLGALADAYGLPATAESGARASMAFLCADGSICTLIPQSESLWNEFFEAIFAARDAKLVPSAENWNSEEGLAGDATQMARVSIGLPLAGVTGNVYVTDNGYLVLCLTETPLESKVLAYSIGVSRAQALLTMLAEGTTESTVISDGTVCAETEMAME